MLANTRLVLSREERIKQLASSLYSSLISYFHEAGTEKTDLDKFEFTIVKGLGATVPINNKERKRREKEKGHFYPLSGALQGLQIRFQKSIDLDDPGNGRPIVPGRELRPRLDIILYQEKQRILTCEVDCSPSSDHVQKIEDRFWQLELDEPCCIIAMIIPGLSEEALMYIYNGAKYRFPIFSMAKGSARNYFSKGINIDGFSNRKGIWRPGVNALAEFIVSHIK